ncbi:MAG: tandem-95 repeat protein, partial [Chloroflexota bacterium]
MHHLTKRFALVLCIISIFFSISGTSQVQTCDYVVALGDSDGLITAIEQANSNTVAETICLNGGTYELTATYETGGQGTLALPLITDELTIEGANSTILDSSSSNYIFEVARYIRVTWQNITFDNSPISNLGELYIDNASVYRGGLETDGTLLDIRNSTIANGGTAIYSTGEDVVVHNTTIENNNERGIYHYTLDYPITITDSIIRNNGDSFINIDEGGGIYVRGPMTVERTTISGNSADEQGGAIYADGGPINIFDSVITDNYLNGEGSKRASVMYVSTFHLITLENNCINGNYNGYDAIYSPTTYSNQVQAENNWWGSALSPESGEQQTGDIIGSAISVDYEPFLTAPVNGCTAPVVDTFSQNVDTEVDTDIIITLNVREGIPPFSYGITALPSNGSLTDNGNSGNGREFLYRPNAGFVGTDSFDFTVTDGASTQDSAVVYINVGTPATANIIVDSAIQEAPFVNNGNCTLGEAIHAANTNTVVDACSAGGADYADVIALSDAAYNFSAIDNTVSLSPTQNLGANALPIITSEIIIRGNGARLSIIETAPDMRFFYTQREQDGPQGVLTLEDMTLQNGRNPHGGGAIYSGGRVSLDNVLLTDNYSSANGGAIYGIFPNIDNTVFESNISDANGGAAYVFNSNISNSTFTYNEATRGGAIEWRHEGTIHNTLFQENVGTTGGGAIYFRSSGDTLTITDSQFFTNSEGAISVGRFGNGGPLEMSNSCIVGNSGTNLSSSALASVENNWWGAHDGPSGDGNGYGEPISGRVEYEPFLISPPAGCPTLDPVALDDSYAVLSRATTDIRLQAGGGLPGYTYTVATQPQHGTLTGTPPSLTYTPNNGYLGTDSFTFNVQDSVGGNSQSSATITLEIETDIAATPQQLTTPNDTPIDITLSATGGTEPYTFVVTEDPATGTLTGTPPNLTYTSEDGEDLTDSFTFQVTDADGFTSSAVITIDEYGKLEVRGTIHFFVTPGSQLSLRPSVAGGVQPYAVEIFPSENATATYDGTFIRYTMNEDYDGIDYLDVDVTDDVGQEVSYTYTFSSAERLSVQRPSLIQVPYEGTASFNITITGGHPPYTSEVVGGSIATIVKIDELSFEITAPADFTGYASGIIGITDSLGFRTTAYIDYQVLDEIIFSDAEIITNYEQQTELPLEVSGGTEPYTYSVETEPTNGAITQSDGNVFYTPNAGFSGEDTFELLVTDDAGGTDTALYTVTVTAPENVSDVSGLIAALQNAYDTELPVTINLAPGTYILTAINNTSTTGANGLPPIRSNVVINGNDATIERDLNATENFRFFDVVDTGSLTLQDMTLFNGRILSVSDNGGAIHNMGDLIITNVTFQDNSAQRSTSAPVYGGAVYSNGNLDVSDSTFRVNGAIYGGAIYVVGNHSDGDVITINNSTFQFNQSSNGSGGAIYAAYRLTIENSTFINNTANDSGGAIAFSNANPSVIENSTFDSNTADDGDAIYISNRSSVNIFNSTFTNHVTLAISNDDAMVSLFDSDVLNNGAGLLTYQDREFANVSIRDSCFVGNTNYAVSAGNDRVSAERNWWGAHDGPSGGGDGYGDEILSDVRFELFLTTPPRDCPVLDPVVEPQSIDVESGLATEISFEVQGGLPPYTFSNVSTPSNGSIIGNPSDGTFEYQSNSGYTGDDSISFDVTDDAGGTANGTLDIIVQAALVAETSTRTIPMDTPSEFTLTSESGTAPFTILSVEQPSNGEIAWESGAQIYYIPEVDFVGVSTFTYQIEDATGKTATHTVEVTTTPRAPATIIVDSTLLENPLTDNGNCTLLEAFEAANRNIAVDMCAAGSATATDIIHVPAGIYEIDRPGSASDVVVRGDGIEQTIIQPVVGIETYFVYVARNGSLTIEMMTLRNGGGAEGGRRGGAIFNNGGDVTLNRVAGISNQVTSQGGFIYNEQGSSSNDQLQVTIYNSAFLNNRDAANRGNVVFSRLNVNVHAINNVFQQTNPGTAPFDQFLGDDGFVVHNCFLGDTLIGEFQNDLIDEFNYGDGALQLTVMPQICDKINELPYVSVSGTVTDYLGQPLSNHTVLFETIDEVFFGSTCTASDGTYVFDVDTTMPPAGVIRVFTGETSYANGGCDSRGYVRQWYDEVYLESEATRIDLTNAPYSASGIDFQMVETGRPPIATGIAPTGLIVDTTPDITWDSLVSTSRYELFIAGPVEFGEATYFVDAADSCDNTGVCTYSGDNFDPPLPVGNYAAYVRGINPDGIKGEWSDGATFT